MKPNVIQTTAVLENIAESRSQKDNLLNLDET